MREYRLNRPSTPTPSDGSKQRPFRKPEQPLTDQSEMPFGCHKGKRMENVPAAYLLWLWDNGVHAQKGRAIHNYIKDALTALLKECPDYILKNHPEREGEKKPGEKMGKDLFTSRTFQTERSLRSWFERHEGTDRMPPAQEVLDAYLSCFGVEPEVGTNISQIYSDVCTILG